MMDLDELKTINDRHGHFHGDRVLRGVGEVVTTRTADGRSVTWCYLTDPEGNLVELQSWSPSVVSGA